MKKNRGLRRREGYNEHGVVTARLNFFDAPKSEKLPPEDIDRVWCKTSEIDKGLLMISKILDKFNITKTDLYKFVESLMSYETDTLRNISRPVWTRDERGNIVSPFRTKPK